VSLLTTQQFKLGSKVVKVTLVAHYHSNVSIHQIVKVTMIV